MLLEQSHCFTYTVCNYNPIGIPLSSLNHSTSGKVLHIATVPPVLGFDKLDFTCSGNPNNRVPIIKGVLSYLYLI